MIKYLWRNYWNYRYRITSAYSWVVIFSIDQFNSAFSWRHYYVPIHSKCKLETFSPLTLQEIESFLNDYVWDDVLSWLYELRDKKIKESEDSSLDFLDLDWWLDLDWFAEDNFKLWYWKLFLKEVKWYQCLMNWEWKMIDEFWSKCESIHVNEIIDNSYTFLNKNWDLNLIDLDNWIIIDTLQWYRRSYENRISYKLSSHNNEKFTKFFLWITEWWIVEIKNWEFETMFKIEWKQYDGAKFMWTEWHNSWWVLFIIFYLRTKEWETDFFVLFENWEHYEIFSWDKTGLETHFINYPKFRDLTSKDYNLAWSDFYYLQWDKETFFTNVKTRKQVKVPVNIYNSSITSFQHSNWRTYLTVVDEINKKIYIYNDNFDLAYEWESKIDVRNTSVFYEQKYWSIYQIHDFDYNKIEFLKSKFE